MLRSEIDLKTMAVQLEPYISLDSSVLRLGMKYLNPNPKKRTHFFTNVYCTEWKFNAVAATLHNC